MAKKKQIIHEKGLNDSLVERIEEDKPIKEKKDRVLVTYDGIEPLHRADAIQYWLQQRNLPTAGTETWKNKLTNLDRTIICMISKVQETGNGATFNALFEQGFGKNTEVMDISGGEEGYEVDFNIPELDTRENDTE